MKYLLILVALAGGYHFYSQGNFNNEWSSNKEASPYKLFQKVANEPVSQDEVINYARDRINETCPMLGDKFAIHDCKVTIANKIDFCIKMFKSGSPDMFHSKEEFAPQLKKLMEFSKKVITSWSKTKIMLNVQGA